MATFSYTLFSIFVIFWWISFNIRYWTISKNLSFEAFYNSIYLFNRHIWYSRNVFYHLEKFLYYFFLFRIQRSRKPASEKFLRFNIPLSKFWLFNQIVPETIKSHGAVVQNCPKALGQQNSTLPVLETPSEICPKSQLSLEFLFQGRKIPWDSCLVPISGFDNVWEISFRISVK